MSIKKLALGIAVPVAILIIAGVLRAEPPHNGPGRTRPQPQGQQAFAHSHESEAATPHVHIVERGDFRFVYANGIPDHEHGAFPNHGNPNRIAEQDYVFRMALKPEVNPEPTAVGHHLFGIAINGIPYDPGTAEWWHRDPDSGWRYEAMSGRANLGLDFSNAHVQPNGSYHYHGQPLELLKETKPTSEMTLVGYAADGFPVYVASGEQAVRSSYRLRDGERPNGPGGIFDGQFVQDYEYVKGSGDLDECNGRTGATPEYPDGIYHYYLTKNFPFIPRLFRGTPDSSFMHGPPAMMGGEPGQGPRGPQGRHDRQGMQGQPQGIMGPQGNQDSPRDMMGMQPPPGCMQGPQGMRGMQGGMMGPQSNQGPPRQMMGQRPPPPPPYFVMNGQDFPYPPPPTWHHPQPMQQDPWNQFWQGERQADRPPPRAY